MPPQLYSAIEDWRLAVQACFKKRKFSSLRLFGVDFEVASQKNSSYCFRKAFLELREVYGEEASKLQLSEFCFAKLFYR